MKFSRMLSFVIMVALSLAGCSQARVPSITQTATSSPVIVPQTEIPTSTPIPTIKPEAVYEVFDESPSPDKFTVMRVGISKDKLLDILGSESEKAAAMSRHPYAEFYADWCPSCTALRKSLGDSHMVEAFSGTYIIRLDLDYWKEKLSGTGFTVVGIPAFYKIGINGRPTGRMITGAAWGDDIPENIAPPMKEFFNGG